MNASGLSAPHGRGWTHYAIGVLLNAAVFLVVGPTIGALILYVIMVGMSAPRADTLSAVFVGSLLLAPLTITVGYTLVWKAALLTGAAVAVASSLTREVLLYPLAAAIGALMILLFAPDRWGDEAMAYVYLSIAGALAAFCCTYLTRGLRLRSMDR